MNSEQTRAAIEAQRNQINEAESRIAVLHRQLRNHSPNDQRRRVNKEEAGKEILRLEDSISNMQGRIELMQSSLPALIASEQAHDAMIAKQEADQRATEAADRAAHDAAVKAAALAKWLTVPGQSEVGFESAWPAIAQRIAVDRAVEAGTAESERAHDAPFRMMAINALAVAYGRKVSGQ